MIRSFSDNVLALIFLIQVHLEYSCIIRVNLISMKFNSQEDTLFIRIELILGIYLKPVLLDVMAIQSLIMGLTCSVP